MRYFSQGFCFVLRRSIICFIAHQASNKGFEIVCQKGNLIIIFLIDVNDFRFTLSAASSIVQHDDIMTG
ncbi:hypothetical protein D3C76_1465330 [compost metagenome]